MVLFKKIQIKKSDFKLMTSMLKVLNSILPSLLLFEGTIILTDDLKYARCRDRSSYSRLSFVGKAMQGYIKVKDMLYLITYVFI